MKRFHTSFLTAAIVFFLFGPTSAQLSGTYLVNPAGGGDFASLGDAAQALSVQGMSGAVTLKLANGIYAEQVEIEIPDHTPDRMLTIESLSGNEWDVVFRYEATAEDSDFQLAFRDVKSLTIRNISINTSELDHGTGIAFFGVCENILIDNLDHKGNRNDAGIVAGMIMSFFDPVTPTHNLTVRNSHFFECSPSVAVGNEFIPPAEGKNTIVQILNNTFMDADGVSINQTDGVTVQGNLAYGELYNVQPIKMYSNSGVFIAENTIYKSFNSLELFMCVGTEEAPLQVVNNFISGSSSVISLNSNEHLLFAHNTVFGDDNGAIGMVVLNQHTRVVNNIFYQNDVDGFLFNLSDNLTQEETYFQDYNCLYSNGDYAFHVSDEGIEYLDYTGYTEMAGTEANGISTQPNFTLPGQDLHVMNQALKQGMPLPEVPTDIDGELRSTAFPTMGADEMDGMAITVDLIIDTVITSGDLNGGEALLVQWSGSNMGNEAFPPSWIDRIFLSDDQILDESDQVLLDYEVEDALPAFGTYARQSLITLDLALQGTKYIIVKIDADVALVEDNTNNIAVSAPFVVTPPDLPNLVVTHIDLPDNVFSGTQLQVDFTVENIGNAPAAGNWKDLVWYVDSIGTFDLGLFDLFFNPKASKSNPVGLMPGDSYVGTATFEIPYIAQGYRYIRVETDGYDQVVEEIDGNDNFHGALTDSVFVNQSPLADLVVENIQTPPESFAGEEIMVSYTVRNTGTETTSPVELPFNFYHGLVWGAFMGDWVDYTYLSDSTLYVNPSNYNRVFSRHGNLEVDSAYIVTQSIRMPSCTAGEYYLTFHADRWNHVAELDESNNAALSDPILIIPRPNPDLVPASAEPPTEPASNSTHTLSYTVENLGADTAFGNWRDWVFLSHSDTFSFNIDELLADSIWQVSLAPDASATFTIAFDIPPHMYGDLYLYLWVDGSNEVCEYPNDDNNVLKIPVTVAQSPSADLKVDFSPPAGIVTAGDALNLGAGVTNVGEAHPNVSVWKDRIFLIDELTVSDTAYAENYTRSGGLPPGATYGLPNPFQIPLDVAPGFYRLGVFADFRDAVWENESEENNLTFGEVFQIVHDSSRAPDLKPLALSAFDWTAGETYAVEVTFVNAGAPMALATWVDALVLTDTNGVEITQATSPHSGAPGANGQYTATFQLTIPVGAPAQAHLVARADTSNEVFEYRETNNVLAFPINITVGPTPDFSPTQLEVSEFVHAGQEIHLSLMRNNFGDVGVENAHWVERVLLSVDDKPDANDYTLRSYSKIDEGFPAAYSEMFIDSIYVPLTMVGTYNVIYEMDAGDHIPEGEMEGNNYVVSDHALHITLPAPVDFAASFVDIQIIDGNPEFLRYTLKNTGENDFIGKFYNTWYLSTDAEYSTDDRLLGLESVLDTDNYPNSLQLAPGESTLQLAGFLYVPVVEGTYYIIQKIDAFLNVHESDENNNTVVYGPFEIDNVQEIFPELTYEKQFGRNILGNVFAHDYGVWPWNLYSIPYRYDSGFDPTPDRHDYRIDIPDGFGMLLRMWEDEAENEQYGIPNESQPIYEMYVGEEYIPSPLNFDFRFDSPMQSAQTVVVPVAEARTDYIKTAAPYIPPHFDPAMVPVSNYFLRAELKEFGVVSLHPEKVGISHNVTLRVTGFDLADPLGLDVALILGTDTVFAFETYPQNPSELIAYIDMREHAPGEYAVMVRKRSTGQTSVWDETVEVVEDYGTTVFVDVNAPTSSRSSQDFSVEVAYGNQGYSNLYDMLVIVAVFMDDSTSTGLDVDYLGATYPGYAGTGFISTEMNQSEPIVLGVLDDAVYYGAYVPIVHARSRESFHFNINGSVPGTITIQASLSLLQRSLYTFSGRTADAGSSEYVTYLANAFASSSDFLMDFAKRDCGSILNADAMTHRLAEQTYAVAEKARGASGFKDDVKKGFNELIDHDSNIKQRHDAFKDLIDKKKELDLTANEDTPFYTEIEDIFKCISDDGGTVSTERIPSEKCYQIATWSNEGVTYKVRMNMRRENSHDCPPLPDPSPRPDPTSIPKSKGVVDNVNSRDPNEIVGPAGIGPARLVEGTETFTYTVYFENVSDASAPAARVRIDNPLDEHLRPASFRIVSFGFADTSFQFNQAPFLQETIDLGPDHGGQLLKVIGGTNPVSGKAFFEFTSLDPATMGMTTGAYDGFLWPNDSTGRGEGFVTYQIEAVRDLTPGTVINNRAAIIFDENEIIETNTWSNTIAGGALESRVKDLPVYSPEIFDVGWEDMTPEFGPPVASFDVYVRDVTAGEPWVKWIDGTKHFGKRFVGTPGHTYAFYSRARTADGAFEVVDGSGDARTTIVDFGGNLDAGLSIFPNPALGSSTLAYSGPGQGAPMRLELTDVSGKIVATVGFVAPGGGVQFQPIPLDAAGAGVYVVTLYHGDNRVGVGKLVSLGAGKE